MSVLGFTNYEYSPTLLGNWSCTTFNKDTGEKLGYFCAESSSVAVFELDEVIKYNPNIIEWLKNNSHTATIISRFTGNVNVVTRTTLEGKCLSTMLQLLVGEVLIFILFLLIYKFKL